MTEEKFQWSREERDFDFDACGESVKADIGRSFDMSLAAHFGWDYMPRGDDGSECELEGVFRKDGVVRVVVSYSRNLSIGHDYTYYTMAEVDEETAEKVLSWVAAHESLEAFDADVEQKVQNLLARHGLDQRTVDEKRAALRREHSLDSELVGNERAELKRKLGISD